MAESKRSRTAQPDTMELLAPAGNEAALRAAVGAGADAVYLGYSAFSARASAANFDGEALAKAVAYAHLYRVRVYVTVNTLVKEREMEALHAALDTIALARADGVIVQDMGAAAMVRRFFPTLDLHASTQMALHNPTGVQWAKDFGFRRVVLARECALDDIAASARTGVEVEVFVHGALCAGVSGQCLLSSMAGGRSGNRGRCAQPCRQQVRCGDMEGALLSTRDLCLRQQIPQLAAAGVRALKIEGRLKRPEYVAIVTDSYRRALDRWASGLPVEEGERGDIQALMQVFHRGGFTVGHAFGAEDAGLCAPERVGHGGLPIGTVERVRNGLAAVRLTADLHDGDGLQLQGQMDIDLRYAGKEQAAGQEAILRLRPEVQAHPGDRVQRLTDARQMEKADQLSNPKPIPVTIRATIGEGRPMVLTLSGGGAQVTVEGEVPQRAQTKQLTPKMVAEQLEKLGNTPFLLAQLEAALYQVEAGLFVPISALNALRRKGVEALIQAVASEFYGKEKELLLREAGREWCKEEAGAAIAREQGIGFAHSKAFVDESPLEPCRKQLSQGPAVCFSQAGMGKALEEAGASLLLWEPFSLRPEALRKGILALPQGAWLQLPPQLREGELEVLRRAVEQHRSRLGGVCLGSIGQLGAGFSLPLALGPGIPACNRLAAKDLLAGDVCFFTLWPEWSYQDLRDMLPQRAAALLPVYGRQRVMVLNHCPLRVSRGLAQGRKDCALCQGVDMACGQEAATLVDRKGYAFPIRRLETPEGCVLSLYNALPTDLSRQESKRKELGAGMLLTFTVEAEEEQLRLVRWYTALCRGETMVQGPLPAGQGTAGHLLRGVE